jgi:glycosyltransferase involved in cell wall biosynthesis
MEHKPLLRRIGVVDQSAAGWTAAGIYSRMMLKSLDSVCHQASIELYFLSSSDIDSDHQSTNVERIQLAPADHLPGERQIRKSLGMGDKARSLKGEARLRNLLHLADNSDAFSVAQKKGIDLLLPLLDVPPWEVAPKLIGWIPDLQHIYLPEFFSERELQKRNATIQRLTERAALIMLSSNAARKDFVSFAPQGDKKARVLSFPSLLAFEPLSENPESSRTKFNIPEKFALVANQFWAHKNHQVVVAGLDHLKKSGIHIPVVMTGLPADHRDPANRNFSYLLQTIASTGLTEQITILGHVPFPDLVNLMRTAALIIQPSRFEGWSTVVEDAKALGRPVACSDIPIHREQAPAALGFFSCDQAEPLVELLATHWPKLEAGPDYEGEQRALLLAREFAETYSRNLIKLCREAVSLNP